MSDENNSKQNKLRNVGLWVNRTFFTKSKILEKAVKPNLQLHKKIRFYIFFIILIVLIVFIYNLFLPVSFEKISDMTVNRAYHKSICIDENNILITGGVNSQKNEDEGLTSAEIYDIKNNSFTPVSNMNLAHIYHSLFQLSNGNILVADINGLEVFDKNTKKFKLLNTHPQTRYMEFNNYKFALLDGDKLVVLGGRREIKNNGSEKGLTDINLIEIIDIQNDKPVKTITFKGSGSGIANLPNKDLLIVGGKSFSDKKDYLLNEIFTY